MHHVLAFLLAINYGPGGSCSVHRHAPITLRCAIAPSRESPTVQLDLASSILSAMSRAVSESRKKRQHREKTYKVNVEVEAEHIGVFIGVTPDSDRELGYMDQLMRLLRVSTLTYLWGFPWGARQSARSCSLQA